ncbi:hypothetical protein KOW79_013544 [Hemibagrus wyckioides]|uniref:Uncharacterized protein n=1 Tax=Hemibagrus wyckioides TaxID=337641 RepID=A0A9D3SGY5_9TELE|nr:hypothetical protein KOW79_013544 [Hemibagrus wyckioides]
MRGVEKPPVRGRHSASPQDTDLGRSRQRTRTLPGSLGSELVSLTPLHGVNICRRPPAKRKKITPLTSLSTASSWPPQTPSMTFDLSLNRLKTWSHLILQSSGLIRFIPVLLSSDGSTYSTQTFSPSSVSGR